jgi:hypothetical protein
LAVDALLLLSITLTAIFFNNRALQHWGESLKFLSIEKSHCARSSFLIL